MTATATVAAPQPEAPASMESSISSSSNVATTNKPSSQPRSRGVILPWDCKLALLQAYKNAKGNLLIPRNYLDPSSGYQLGRLVYRLRQGKARLSSEQVDALNALGFVWNRSPCTTWNKWFDLLQDYQREYGHVCPTHKQLYKNQKLGQWVMQQRVMYERKQKQLAGQLQSSVTSISQDRIDRLNSIGFLWRLSTSRKEVVMTNNANQNGSTGSTVKKSQDTVPSSSSEILPQPTLSEEDVANLGQDAAATTSLADGSSSSLMDVTIQCLLQDAVKELETTSPSKTTSAAPAAAAPKKKKRSSSSSSSASRKKLKKTPSSLLSSPSSVPVPYTCSSDVEVPATPSMMMDDSTAQDLVSFLDTLPQNAADDAIIMAEAGAAVPQVPTSCGSSSHLYQSHHHQDDDSAALVSSDSSAASEDHHEGSCCSEEETDSCSGATSNKMTPTTSVDGLSRSLSVTFAEDVQVQILTDNEQQQQRDEEDAAPSQHQTWNEKEKMMFIQNFFD